MLGRQIPLDDAFQNVPLRAENPRMEELRRQRTIRTFMMFLLLLIMMDGEDPKNRQMRINRQKKYLRQNNSGLLLNKTLSEDLLKRMRLFDSKLHRVSIGHSRFDRLINLNGGVDEEARIDEWAMQEIDRQQKEVGKKSQENDEKDDQLDEEASRLIYHYPRNATGYYRGKWEVINNLSNNTEKTTKTTVREGHIIDLDSSNSSLRDSFIANISDREDEIIDKLKERRKDQESLGVFLLPPEIKFSNEGLAAPSDFKNSRDRSLTITESTGKSVFKLYSRAAPAIREISLIDGFVSLYDVNNEHFASPRKHLFLRVRGVAIHSIGRLSLVANDDLFRSALLLKDEDDRIKGGSRKSTAKVHDPHVDDDNNRRRLLDSISGLRDDSPERHDNVEAEKLITRIRDNAVKLFIHYFNVDEVGGGEWNSYLDEIVDYPDDMSLRDPENSSSRVNTKAQEKGMMRSSHANIERNRSLRSKSSVSNVEVQSGKNNSLTDISTLKREKGVSDNRFLMNKTIFSDVNTAQSKLSVTGDQSKTQLVEGTRMDHKIPSSLFFHPFVPDDETLSLEKLPSFITKNPPSKNQIQNGQNCEFEINLDIKETKWSVGEWRTMALRLIKDSRASDPSNLPGKKANFSYEEIMKSEHQNKKKRDEALVMNLFGTIESPDCHFASTVNLTAVRTDWEQAQCKAINYSFYMMLACLTQIVLLLRQLIHTQNQSAAIRVSMLCIGWQGILDAMLCVGHILLCMMMQPVFTAFAMVAFFKLLIFCVIEMKYMVIIMQARVNADNNYSPEDLRRRVASLHLRFYCVLIVVLVMFWTLIQRHRALCLFSLYSFWVPQIIQNIITESKNPLHVNYIYGMSLTRLIPPLYMYGVPNNFFMEFFPEYTSDRLVCGILIFWVGLQAGILIAQGKYGTRFMIPKRCLPPKYDYSRQIPDSLLPRKHSNERRAPEDVETNKLIGSDDKGPRNRKFSSKNGTDDSHGVRTIIESNSSTEGTRLDCVICYGGINIENKRGYMLAPCDHIFHRDCLEQWMEVKMECPICRMALPSI